MKNVLVINSSLNAEQGNSAKLAKHLAQHLSAKYQSNVHTVNLYAGAISHFSDAEMQAWMTDAQERSPEQNALAQISDSYIEQVLAADTIVLGMPMYNFGVPSTFKAWVDRIAKAGVTFQYTAEGPVGLLKDKKIIVLAAKGGMYQGTPKDTQTAYLRDVFAFLGLQDVDFVYAEGLAMAGKEESMAGKEESMAGKEESMAAAIEQLEEY